MLSSEDDEATRKEGKNDDAATAFKVLFLSADTGGGHRASAEALGKQFEAHFPGSTYELVDVWTLDGVFPYRTLVDAYKYLSAHPHQWRLFYHLSNTVPNWVCTHLHSRLMCQTKILNRIESYHPDIVVSVHPTMNHVPRIATEKISKRRAATRRKTTKTCGDQQQEHCTAAPIPFFTVVTDLGSGHHMWFERKAERVYVASDRMRRLARRRGFVPKPKIVMTGLPIRHAFAHHAEQIMTRMTTTAAAAAGGTGGNGSVSDVGKKNYQRMIRQQLGGFFTKDDNDDDTTTTTRRVVLVMGGGEGVGSLSKIVDALYLRFVQDNIHADIYAICGRNTSLQNDISQRDWTTLRLQEQHRNDKKKKNLISASEKLVKRRKDRVNKKNVKQQDETDLNKTEISSKGNNDNDDDMVDVKKQQGNVRVVALGFVNEMAEYMVAADVLVTKAGPGTIAEATAVGLPIMLTSYLPGQEAGNVKIVLEGGFGDYCNKPKKMAQKVSAWLQDDKLLTTMSSNAMEVGQPTAASDIVKDIGEITKSLIMAKK